MGTEHQAYEKWRSQINKDRKGEWRKVDMSILVFGGDSIQDEIQRRLEENQRELGTIGRGLMAYFVKRRLKKEQRDLTAEYYRRASELRWQGFQRG